ncbi:sterol desaturase family protein [Antarcticibacterium arcticum]|uniref:Sterol desaturase family protein n=1 Tax=Antarcticibacterium arcticum TaxID=2585771 RepID=A0A5B8YRC5_9FLAO|nr:sterol desaturase family protein [Antarcticibacterium arcticum]QED38629.1 sterol desaturase family protein [Antarcticibacterium arcticum]
MILQSNTPGIFLVYILIFFLALLFRYFVAAGVFYWYYYKLRAQRYSSKRLSKRKHRKGQIKKEIVYSIKSSVIFAAVGAGTYWLYQQGVTAIYIEPSQWGYWYLPLSLLLVFLIHETYYYWVHRAMHHPKIFKYVHKVHHDSLTPTPWTAFSFHPWESIIEALILPIILIFLPVNIYVLGFYLLFMTLSSVINHLDIEIYPPKFLNSGVGKQFIGATHHHHHHTEFNTNYGLYFNFWDRWMGTESNR